MAWGSKKYSKKTNTDPFHADDPVMPWDADSRTAYKAPDPEPVDDADCPSDPFGQAASDFKARVQDAARKATSAAGSADSYTKSFDAKRVKGRSSSRTIITTTTNGVPKTTVFEHSTGNDTLKKAVKIIVTIVVACSILFAIAGAVIAADEERSEVADIPTISNDLGSWHGYEGYESSTAADEAAEQDVNAVVQARMDALTSGQDAAAAERIASRFDETLNSYTGYSAAELGIDTAEYAQWIMTSTSYTTDWTYVDVEDGEASAYLYTKCVDVYDFQSNFVAEVADILNPGRSSGSADSAPTDLALSRVAAAYEQARANATFDEDGFIGVDLTCDDARTWTISDDAWDMTLMSLYILY